MGTVNRRGYWGILPGEIKRDPELTIAARYLYVILSSMAYEDGYCWPSNEYLAGEIGLSKRRVVELLALLRARGYIQISMRACKESHTGERRYIYCGMFPDRAGAERPEEGCEISHGEDANDRGGGCEISQEEDEIFRTLNISRKTNKKDNNPLPPKPSPPGKPNTPEGVAAVFDGYAGEDGELRQLLADFQESRVNIKKPLHTQRAAKILLNKLDRLSGGDRGLKLALLETSILHGWESVYPLKEDGQSQQGKPGENAAVLPEGGTWI